MGRAEPTGVILGSPFSSSPVDVEPRPCGWCGLLTGPGPVCMICGSPQIDVSMWSTVLRPAGLVVPAVAAVPVSPETGAPADLGPPSELWVRLDDAASRSGVSAASLRSWVEARLRDPLPGAAPDDAWFLLVERSKLEASGLWLVRDAVEELERPAARRAEPADADPSTPTSGSADPELGSAWAFEPPAARMLRERIRRFAVTGAAAVAVSGAGEAVYLLLRH